MSRNIGIVLIIAGLLGLLYGGLTYNVKESLADIGPIHVSREKTHTLPLPPIAGALAVMAGIALVVTGNKSRSTV